MQVRKWIRNHEALRMARPGAKLVLKARALARPRTSSPTSSSEDSETESLTSFAPETPPVSRQSSFTAKPPASTPEPLDYTYTEDVRAAEDLLLLLTGSAGH